MTVDTCANKHESNTYQSSELFSKWTNSLNISKPACDVICLWNLKQCNPK